MKERLGQAKITRGGQVTFSKKVREALGVDIGDYLVFQMEGSKLVVMPAEIKIKAIDTLRG